MAVEDLVRTEVNRITSGTGSKKKETRPIKHVSGFVSNPKKSPMRKFADVFFEEDLKTVKESLIREVVIPTIKGFLADIFIGGIERTLYGSSGRGTSNVGRTLTNSLVRSVTSTPYNDYTQAQRTQVINNQPRFSFRDVVMRDRSSAEDLLRTLREAIDRYGNVSVAELYDALDATDEAGSDYMDNKWGWTNLDNVQIKRVNYGYWLDLPRPVALTNN